MASSEERASEIGAISEALEIDVDGAHGMPVETLRTDHVSSLKPQTLEDPQALRVSTPATAAKVIIFAFHSPFSIPALRDQMSLQLVDWAADWPLVLPYFDGTVPAGFLSPAEDYLKTPLDLHGFLIDNKAATFLMRVNGDSMRDAGILDGDLLVVDRVHDRRRPPALQRHGRTKAIYRQPLTERSCLRLL